MNSPETEAAFMSIVEGLGQFDQGDYTDEPRNGDLEPADEAIQAILDQFTQRLLQHGAVDLADRSSMDRAIRYLSAAINQFVYSNESLTFSDRITVRGGVPILCFDQGEESLEALWLDIDSHLTGDIVGTYVGPIPDESAFVDAAESDDANQQIIPTIKFGLALMLGNATLVNSEGQSEPITGDQTLCIPLNYSSVRILKQL